MITSSEGSRRLAEINDKVSLKLWDDGYHELHNEPEKKNVLEYTSKWIKDYM